MEAHPDPVSGVGHFVLENVEHLFGGWPHFQGGHDQIFSAVAVEVGGDNIARIEFESDAGEIARLEKTFALLVEIQTILLITGIGKIATAGAGEFGFEVEI